MAPRSFAGRVRRWGFLASGLVGGLLAGCGAGVSPATAASTGSGAGPGSSVGATTATGAGGGSSSGSGTGGRVTTSAGAASAGTLGSVGTSSAGAGNSGTSSGGGCFADAGPFASGDLYVATDGDDRWAGTLPTPAGGNGPLATVGAAETKVAAILSANPARSTPVVVLIRGGTYALSSALVFNAVNSGTSSAEVIYAAYPGEAPIFSGGAALGGWVQGATAWTASAAGLSPFAQLFVDGVSHPRPFSASGYLYNQGPVYLSAPATNCPKVDAGVYECVDRFRFRAGDLDPAWQNLTDVEIDDFEYWTMARLRLQSVDATNHIAYLTGPTYNPPYHGFIPGHRYLAENVKEGLSRPGQWYLDSSQSPPQVTYLAAPGEDPNAEAIVAPQTTQLLQANGLSHVTFRGLTFSFASWTVPAAGHPSGQGEQNVGAVLSFQSCSHLVLDGCTVSHVGPWAIAFLETAPGYASTAADPYDFQVVNSVLTDLGAGGIRIGRPPSSSGTAATVAQHVLVQNTRIQGGGRLLPQGCGIWVGDSHDNLLSHDEIADFYNSGISLGFTFSYAGGLATGNVAQFNLIHDLGQGVTSDMGGIYTLVSDPPNGTTLLTDNVIHDVTHDPDGGYGGWGLYFDEGSTNVIARNNLVFDTSTASVHQNWGQTNTLQNNILAFGALGELDRTREDPPGSLSLTVENNLFEWDLGSLQYGDWRCDEVNSVATNCPSYFKFTSNLYFDTRGQNYLFSTTSPFVSYDLAGWQALGEDAASRVADPRFKNPDGGDFTLLPASPASAVGFQPFDASQAGLLPCAPPAAAPVPASFPLQLHGPF